MSIYPMGILTQRGESWTPPCGTAEHIFKWRDLKMSDKGARFVGVWGHAPPEHFEI